MDRRTFLNWVGFGLLASSMPVALAACSSKSTESTTKEFRQIGLVSDLEKDGQILNQEKVDNPVLVVRDAANPSELVAVNPTCTHRDCVINWDKERNVFLCTCHDSKFDTAGKVLSPPAEEPLQLYQVKIEGARIFVSHASVSG